MSTENHEPVLDDEPSWRKMMFWNMRFSVGDAFVELDSGSLSHRMMNSQYRRTVTSLKPHKAKAPLSIWELPKFGINNSRFLRLCSWLDLFRSSRRRPSRRSRSACSRLGQRILVRQNEEIPGGATAQVKISQRVCNGYWISAKPLLCVRHFSACAAGHFHHSEG